MEDNQYQKKQSANILKSFGYDIEKARGTTTPIGQLDKAGRYIKTAEGWKPVKTHGHLATKKEDEKPVKSEAKTDVKKHPFKNEDGSINFSELVSYSKNILKNDKEFHSLENMDQQAEFLDWTIADDKVVSMDGSFNKDEYNKLKKEFIEKIEKRNKEKKEKNDKIKDFHYQAKNSFTLDNEEIILNRKGKTLPSVHVSKGDKINVNIQSGSLGDIVTVDNLSTGETAKFWSYSYGTPKIISENVTSKKDLK